MVLVRVGIISLLLPPVDTHSMVVAQRPSTNRGLSVALGVAQPIVLQESITIELAIAVMGASIPQE